IGIMRIRPLVLAPALLAAIIAAAVTWSLLDRDEPRTAPAPTAGARPELAAAAPFRYDVEYPFMAYRTATRTDPVADLARRIENGDARLELRGPRGLLDSLLAALDIDPASQVLVFSTTSLQVGNISPRTPRAIYFNDDVYVAWVQGGGPIEIASMDPVLGPVFYLLAHEEGARLEQQNERCLRCHDSLSLSGEGVPRFIVGSGYIGTDGSIVTHEGWILTSQRTPFRNRLGGWYVTGRHGEHVHLGRIVVRDVYALRDLEALRNGNPDSLEGLVAPADYAAPHAVQEPVRRLVRHRPTRRAGPSRQQRRPRRVGAARPRGASQRQPRLARGARRYVRLRRAGQRHRRAARPAASDRRAERDL